MESDVKRENTNPDTSVTPDATREVTVTSTDEERGDTVFDIELSEFKTDPKLVNVHQFYPKLEHSFTKSSTKFAEEQDRRVEDAMKEIVDETTNLTFTSTEQEGGAEEKDLKQEETQDSLLMIKEGTADGGEPDDNNSAKEGTAVGGEPEDNNSAGSHKKPSSEPSAKGVGLVFLSLPHVNLFSTAVSEETLAQAKARKEQSDSIFKTEDWGPVGKYSARMQEILDAKAEEHFQQAMECKKKEDYQGTIVKINKAMSLRPEDHVYFVERAEAFVHLCDFQSAILNYKKACLLEPDNDDYYSRLSFLYYFQGQTLFDQRLFPEALESFSRAAEMTPNNVGYHIRSITCLAALQRHGECLALVNKRLETESNNPDLYIMRARLHEMFRNTTLSYYDIKDALALNEDHAEAKLMMEKLQQRAQDNKLQAMQLNLVGKHREGLHKISVAIETDPSVAEFHVIRGCLHRKLADFNSAIDDFLLALDKCDHNEDSTVYVDSQRQLLLTYNDFAVECFTKGYYEEAIILLNKSIKGEKREKGLYINRGDCFFRQQDLNFALQDYTQALELDPNDFGIRSRISVIHNEFGVTAYQDKNYSEAETKFTLAIQSNPKVGQYYISRSRSRYMMENMNGARQDLIMGLLLDPTNEDVISILSRLFPGKSVSDVVHSRVADAAKIALNNMMRPPRTTAGTTFQSQTDVDDGGEGEIEEGAKPKVKSAKTEISQADTEISAVDEKLWKPGGCFPDIKACMKEYEFNVRLVAEKNEVKEKLKGALHDRKSLKYLGARVGPMPPPMDKPQYGGRKFNRERRIKSPSLLGKKQSYNWKQCTMGIGLPITDVGDV